MSLAKIEKKGAVFPKYYCSNCKSQVGDLDGKCNNCGAQLYLNEAIRKELEKNLIEKTGTKEEKRQLLLKERRKELEEKLEINPLLLLTAVVFFGIFFIGAWISGMFLIVFFIIIVFALWGITTAIQRSAWEKELNEIKLKELE